MKIFNTLSRQIEEVEPIKPPNLGFYACGPTVYDYTHIGHLRRYMFDDVLIRVLRNAEFKVKHVMNVTDVGHLSSDADTGEDKLEKGAKKYGLNVWDIAKKFEKIFFDSNEKIGNQRPDVVCRATEYIEEQLELVKILEKKGFTYIIPNDGVYFNTSKFPEYGRLAKIDKEKIREGARVEKVIGKKNPTDFALWKFEREGENRQMIWESPWSKRSFPGWHIECSAMSMKNLGAQIDIHSGGIEHLPVHHPNEIAQSETATGKKPFVKYWIHHNHLLADGQKMSKSLGNVYNIDDVIAKGFDPMALRLLFLSAHYRDEMNFTWQALEGAQKAWEKLENILLETDYQEDLVISQKGQDYQEKFYQFLEDDLRTPEALALMWEVVKSGLPRLEIVSLVKEFTSIFGIKKPIAREKKNIPFTEELKKLLERRKKAREEKNWVEADKVRAELAGKGFEVTDKDNGEQELSIKE